MEGIIILVAFILLLGFWFKYQSDYNILDIFSPVKTEYGVITEKEYIPPQMRIITRKIIHTHKDFGRTSYDVSKEIQVHEKSLLYIKLGEKILITLVTNKIYENVNRGDYIFVRYSQGRFSKNIYLKKVRYP